MPRRNLVVAVAIYIACAAEFIVDIRVDQVIAFGIFYLPMVGTAVFYRDPRMPWKLGAIASAMVAVGYFLPRINESVVEATINRLASIAAILVTAGLISYARRTQEQLAVQTQRAERADQAKVRMLTSLSRELLTPLNAIIGFSEMLQATSRPDQREYLGHIQFAGRRLLATFRNLIDLTHADERALQAITLGIGLPLEEAVRATQVQAAERRVRIVLAGGPPWPDVTGDAWAIRRVLENLLSNAVKFSNPDDTVTVTAEPARDGVAVVVRDQGIGMSPHVVPRLGELFFQADLGPSRQFEGMGAGLALAFQLAAGMGAALRFESAPGMGTVARLMLPPPRRLAAQVERPRYGEIAGPPIATVQPRTLPRH